MDANGIAAWLAALTSAATLVVTTYVGGRRDHHRWVRDALTDAFVAFLSASWKHSDLAKEAASDGGAAEDMAAQYREMRNQLTRLRLLATNDVLRAGEELLRLQRAVQESAAGPERERALTAAAAGRRSVVSAAKREMGLL
ncbi:hypothetical protein [Streptomyces sp. NPDC001492]